LTLLFDENFPPELPEALRLFGVSAVHTLDRLPAGTEDLTVFAFLREHGWYWVTHDKGVKRKKHEQEAVIREGVGVFYLTGRVQRSDIQMLRFVLEHLDDMHHVIARVRPPFIYGISDRGKFERLK
jgi:predicted nuclease of predicted toxin-antitoxin system